MNRPSALGDVDQTGLTSHSTQTILLPQSLKTSGIVPHFLMFSLTTCQFSECLPTLFSKIKNSNQTVVEFVQFSFLFHSFERKKLFIMKIHKV